MSRDGRCVYFLPLLVILWANLHGGFIFALFFVTLAIGVEVVHALSPSQRAQHAVKLRTLGLVWLGTALAGLVTPHGLDLYRYVASTQFNGVLTSWIAEWRSPDFHRLDVRPMEFVLLLLMVGFAFRRPRLWDVVLVVVGTFLALAAVRHSVIFVAMVTPVLAWSYSAAWEQVRQAEVWVRVRHVSASTLQRGLVALLAVTVLGSGAFVARTLRGQASSTRANYPVSATNWLAANSKVGTRMYNAYDWGGYLINRLYPRENRRVFAYGESELLGEAVLHDISDISKGKPDWRTVFTRHGIDLVMERSEAPISTILAADPGWQKTYDDGFAAIYLRR